MADFFFYLIIGVLLFCIYSCVHSIIRLFIERKKSKKDGKENK